MNKKISIVIALGYANDITAEARLDGNGCNDTHVSYLHDNEGNSYASYTENIDELKVSV